MKPATRALVLGLGNDLLGDDGIGLTVARALRGRVPRGVDVVESGEAGLALLELLNGYDRAVIIDAMQSGAPPGTIHHLDPSTFDRVLAPSAHYAGLPEVFELAQRLGIAIPTRIAVLAIAVLGPFAFSEHLSPAVADAVEPAAEAVLRELN